MDSHVARSRREEAASELGFPLPAGWDARKLKFASKRIVGGGTPASGNPEYWDGSIVWVTPQDVSRAKILSGSRRMITPEGLASCSAELVPAGSVILTGRAPVGNVSVAAIELATNQGCKAVIPDERIALSGFITLALEVFKPQIEALAKGTTFQEISGSALGNLAIPLPPLDEQAAIARYCAHLDAKVNRLIRNKRRLIALLNEQKQVIIQQAITRGLDPSEDAVASGVPWLGNINPRWETQRLRGSVSLLTGFPFASSGFSTSPDDIRLLRGVNVGVGSLRWDSTVRWPNTDAARFAAYRLREDDIILGLDRPIIGKGIRVARVQAVDLPSLLLQRVARIRAGGAVHPDFLYLHLQGKPFLDYLTPLFTGISVPHISPTQVSNFIITVPPLDEQHQIVEHVKASTADLDAATGRIEQELELIREYRNRLVADVVTGQLDVRAAAASLPDLDPLDAAEPDAAALDEDDAGSDFDDLPAEETDADD